MLRDPDAAQVIPAVHKKKGDIKAEPRGIYTTVPRSGGYGTNNFTLSETKKGSKGVVRPPLVLAALRPQPRQLWLTGFHHWPDA